MARLLPLFLLAMWLIVNVSIYKCMIYLYQHFAYFLANLKTVFVLLALIRSYCIKGLMTTNTKITDYLINESVKLTEAAEDRKVDVSSVMLKTIDTNSNVIDKCQNHRKYCTYSKFSTIIILFF